MIDIGIIGMLIKEMRGKISESIVNQKRIEIFPCYTKEDIESINQSINHMYFDKKLAVKQFSLTQNYFQLASN